MVLPHIEAMLRPAAAGSISRAFTISIPIHFIDSITITAIRILNESSNRLDLIFLLFAKDTFTPTE